VAGGQVVVVVAGGEWHVGRWQVGRWAGGRWQVAGGSRRW
jgi:hypothetical protein